MMREYKNTKIVATISDGQCDTEFLGSLVDAGVNVVRINTAHQTPETSIEVVDNVRAVSDSVALLVDTKGPEIRTSNVTEPFDVEEGDKLLFKGGDGISSKEVIYADYPDFAKDIPVGSQILIDDGEIEMVVTGKTDDALEVVIGNSAKIKNKKSINVPGVSFNLASISAKDKQYIEWSAEVGIDFIAHSFVRNAADCKAVQEILDSKGSSAKIIAKIENLEGVENIDEILDHAYGVMVARGDLGIEIEAAKIPAIQREIIRKCIARRRPVIVATQLLHTMIDNPRPTRAEVSDIASAVYSRTDAVMLSGETAYGKYPLEAVQTMAAIIKEVEKDEQNKIKVDFAAKPGDVPGFLSREAVRAANAEDLNIKAIVNNPLTGKTSRILSSFRSNHPIFAKCYCGNVVRELALSYGVQASIVDRKDKKTKIQRAALRELVESNDLKIEDNVVYVGGSFGVNDGTTLLEIGSVKKLTYYSDSDKMVDAE